MNTAKNMQETMRPQELQNVDFSKIPGLQQKRTVAFVNHFVMTNVQFLNDFSNKCEKKLMLFERKLEKINAAMVLLEARLSSIPELNIPSQLTCNNTSEDKETASADTTDITIKDSESAQINIADNSKEPKPILENAPNSPTELRPEYDRFIKMVQVGVPVQAVKLKVSLEGLDPNVLDEILNK